MELLPILFWVLLVLAILGFWCPEPYVRYVRGVDLVLLLIIGLRVFPINLH